MAVIVHHSDMDGITAGGIVYNTLKEKNPDAYYACISYSYESYMTLIDRMVFDTDYETVPEKEEVFFVDISLSDAIMDAIELLLKRSNRVIFIDHHQTSVDYIDTFLERLRTSVFNESFGRLYEEQTAVADKRKYILPFIVDRIVRGQFETLIDTDESGAALAWRYFHGRGSTLPTYVTLVSDYDTWTFEHGDRTTWFETGYIATEGLNVSNNPANPAISACVMSQEMADLYKEGCLEVENINSGNTPSTPIVDSLIEKGKIIDGYIQTNNKRMLKQHGSCGVFRINEEKEHSFAAINYRSNSKIFGALYDAVDYCFTYIFDPNTGKFKVSVYSHADNDAGKQADCLMIARAFGGGGHKGAAGFNIEIEDFQIIVNGYEIAINVCEKFDPNRSDRLLTLQILNSHPID